jgi:hypothetical protein
MTKNIEMLIKRLRMVEANPEMWRSDVIARACGDAADALQADRANKGQLEKVE